jgi:hypothetical protein
MNSLAAMRAFQTFNNPAYWALVENTMVVGLRRSGFPEE